MLGDFDFIVVGAGSAGSVAAARLAASGSNVALLEEGGPVPDSVYLESQGLPLTFGSVPVDMWHHIRGDLGDMFQVRALGGGSALNHQIYTRAAASDFPYWSAESVLAAYEALEASVPRVLVSPDWEEMGHMFTMVVSSLEHAVPNLRWRLDPHEPATPTARISGYFRSQQPWFEAVDRERRSWTKVTRAPTAGVCREAFMRAANRSVGMGARMRRSTPYENLIAPGLRPQLPTSGATLPDGAVAGQLAAPPSASSSSASVTAPKVDAVAAKGPRPLPKLRVFSHSKVEQVLLEGSRAIGVRLANGNVVHAKKEVILSAGALASPAILRRSGLPRRKSGKPVSTFPLYDKFAVWVTIVLPRMKCGLGVMKEVELIAFLNASSPTTEELGASAEFEVYLTEGCCGEDFCFILGIILLRPSKPGRLKLRPGNTSYYELRPLADEDVDKFRQMFDKLGAAFRRVELLLRHQAPAWDLKVYPDIIMTMKGKALRAELTKRVRNFNHPTSTLPMGSAVGSRLQLLGDRPVKGLRVADASVLPLPVSGHTDGAAQLVGYMAASFAMEDSAGSP